MASVYDYIGEAARMGAVLAGDQLGNRAESLGMRLEVLLANSPTAEAAFRAAERLVATEDVCALIGGLGKGQAQALAAVADAHRIPFFHIGSPAQAPQSQACNRHTFHVEASPAMYLHALVDWFVQSAHRRWFLVYEDSGEGRSNHDLALTVLSQHASGGAVVGIAAVLPEQPSYTAEIETIRRSEADTVLLLLEARDQIAFLAQAESLELDVSVAPFPEPVTQSREYLATARYMAPRIGAGYRAALWDTTLEAHGAKELNELYMSRWGEPMDPSAWAAYQSVHMLLETVIAVGAAEGSELVNRLERPEAVFDVSKSTGVSFRPRDHQLRQPLYIVQIDPDAAWGVQLSRKQAIARVAREAPYRDMPDVDLIRPRGPLEERADETRCRF